MHPRWFKSSYASKQGLLASNPSAPVVSVKHESLRASAVQSSKLNSTPNGPNHPLTVKSSKTKQQTPILLDHSASSVNRPEKASAKTVPASADKTGLALVQPLGAAKSNPSTDEKHS